MSRTDIGSVDHAEQERQAREGEAAREAEIQDQDLPELQFANEQLTPRRALEQMHEAFVDWLHTRPEVRELDELGDGIYGAWWLSCPVSITITATP